MDGPKETAVRATLAKRPAGALATLPRDVRYCFAGLFNGAFQHNAYVTAKGHFSCGKAECEWGWPGDWEKLRDAGLITFSTERKDAPGAIDGYHVKVTWGITDEGWKVRDDDLAYFRELMAARDQDEAVKSDSTNPT